MTSLFISDLGIKDYPFGGGEQVNNYICSELGIPFVKASQIDSYNNNITYIISSCFSMNPHILSQIVQNGNYILIEHDYKFIANRNPRTYPYDMVPNESKINIEYYKNARAIFCQTRFHQNVFYRNEIPGNYLNFISSIWDPKDLDMITDIYKNMQKNGKFAIHNHIFELKNTKGAIEYCKFRKFTFELINNSNSRYEFLKTLSSYSALVFIPLTPETCSRICIEARCFDMNVICSNDFGCTIEDWFTISGLDMIKFIKSNTENNIKLIKEYL
jgi:hypothetical protein